MTSLTLMASAIAIRNCASLSGAFLVFGTSHAVLADSMYGAFGKYVWTYPRLTSSATPGRKLLLRSRPPWSTMPSALLLEPLTMSTMYVGMTGCPAAMPHQLGFLTQTMRSSAWVLYM